MQTNRPPDPRSRSSPRPGRERSGRGAAELGAPGSSPAPPGGPTRLPRPRPADPVTAAEPAGSWAGPGRPIRLARIDRGSRLVGNVASATQPDSVSARISPSSMLSRGRLTGALNELRRAAAAQSGHDRQAPTDPAANNPARAAPAQKPRLPGRSAIAEGLPRRADQLQALATIGDAGLELGSSTPRPRPPGPSPAQSGAPPSSRASRILAALQGRPADSHKLSAAALITARAADDRHGTQLYAFLAGKIALEDGERMRADARPAPRSPLGRGYYTALGGPRPDTGRPRRHRGGDLALQRAAAVVPKPETLAALGDLYARVGDEDAAQQQYEAVRAIATPAAMTQQVYNRELALFDADHGVEPAEALGLAPPSWRPERTSTARTPRMGARSTGVTAGRRRHDTRPHARHSRRALRLSPRHDRGRPPGHGPWPRPADRGACHQPWVRSARPGTTRESRTGDAPRGRRGGAGHGCRDGAAAPRADGRARPSPRQLHDQPLRRVAHRDDGRAPRRRWRSTRREIPTFQERQRMRHESRRHGRCGRDRGRAADGLRRIGQPAEPDRGRWRDRARRDRSGPLLPGRRWRPQHDAAGVASTVRRCPRR